MRKALVTGVAGFIGSHLLNQLLIEGWQVTGIDNFDPFYDPTVKEMNIAKHATNERFRLIRGDIGDIRFLKEVIDHVPDVVVHLAAKVGVRSSVADPAGYHDVNVRGTQNLLELTRLLSIRQFVFASSSSVYGINPNLPWREDDRHLLPISPYASSKLCAETMGYVYALLYGCRFMSLRLFTVYGPGQRPDLAIHQFGKLMSEGKHLPLFGNGRSKRAYTFIGDVVRGIRAAMDYTASMYEIVNIGSREVVTLTELIAALEKVSGLRASVQWLPGQPGDVPVTCPDTQKAKQVFGFETEIDLPIGLQLFWEWLTRCHPDA